MNKQKAKLIKARRKEISLFPLNARKRAITIKTKPKTIF
jgi:hypothetical protein